MRVDLCVQEASPSRPFQPSDNAAEHERSLVVELRSGDRGAFDAVYDAYRAKIHCYFLRVVRHEAVALELSQETWLRVATRAHGLAEGSNLGAWLFTVARNVYRSYRRWSLLDRDRLAEFGLCAPRSDVPTPLDVACRSELQRHMELAIGALPPKYREVIVLVSIEGFDSAQVARITSLSPAALRKRLSRARTLLENALARCQLTDTQHGEPAFEHGDPKPKDGHVTR